MATEHRHDAQRATFPTALLGGLLAVVVVSAVAWLTVGALLAVPVLVLGLILVGAAIAYRTAGTSPDAPTNNRDNVPRLRADEERPLGDTTEAHDEINPHDLPPDHPGRHAAEEMAQSAEGSTSGMAEGGAAGAGGPEEGAGGRREPHDEAKEGARDVD
jgi:hypothetical protein